ncbi:unnamed protein product [Calicophoron daubneyi]|uniref:ARID domain-containing protein n=1 Tax=Calicophoron daubneyi TaxID=300641 RepID=A0AAV2T3Q6_CALDB
MDYPNTNMGSAQPNYAPHLQDPARASPGCNASTSANTFTEIAPHHRAYAPYPQPYQQPHDYGGPPGQHTGNTSGYSQVYSSDSSGQSLTLNQLLQQGNTPGNYQVRPPHVGPPGQAPYRSYEQYGYGYKPGASVNFTDRGQANMYPYGSQNQRFSDPYSRSLYPSYPQGAPYSYYQGPGMSQQRQPAGPPTNMDYPPMSSTGSSRPPQPTTPAAGQTNAVERSGSVGTHGRSSPANSSQMSSPVINSCSNATGNQPSNWQMPAPPFGSPLHLNHGQTAQASQPTRPRSSSRDQQLRSTADSVNDSHGSSQGESSIVESSLAMPPVSSSDETGSRPQSRLSDIGRPPTANSSGSGVRDQPADEQNTQISSDSQQQQQQPSSAEGLPSAPSSSAQPIDSSPKASSSGLFVNNSTPSPITAVPRSTPPTQPYASFAQQPSSNNTPSPLSNPSQPVQIGPNQHSPGAINQPRPMGLSSQMRSYSTPMQGAVARSPYPPYIQQQQNQQGGQYVCGRPGFFPGSGHPMRPMSSPASSPLQNRIPSSSMYSNQMGTVGAGMMPPPAAPPPNQSGPAVGSGNGPPSQSTFMAGEGGPYSGSSGMMYGGQAWDQQTRPTGPMYPNSISSSPAQSMPFDGRPPQMYNAAGDRGGGYTVSQQSNNPTTGGAAAIATASTGGAMPYTGPHSQTPAGVSAYPHPQVPPSYPGHHHPQMPYSSSQPPYHSHSIQAPHGYSSMGSSSPMPPQNQSLQSQGGSVAPPPYPSAMLSTGSQPSRDHFHPTYGQDMMQPSGSERGTPGAFGAAPLSAAGTDVSGLPGPPRGSPVGAMRTPVSGSGCKPVPGGVVGKASKLDGVMRSATPNNPTSMMQDSSPSLTGSTPNLGGEEMPTGPAAQHHPPQYMVASGGQSSSMQSFSGQSGYWPDGAAPGQFMAGGGGPPGPHGYPNFQPHYRQPMSPQMPPQNAHSLPNSVGCPLPGPLYGGGMVPHSVSHLHPSAISAQSSSGFHKLLEMGNEPERRGWLEHYVRFMEEIGKPLVGLPQVVKQPLDLYRFYLAVRDRGGVLEVIKARRWKEISQLVNINASASAAYTLRKNYCKFLLDYECRFDRGGADPRLLLAHIESMSGKKKKASSNADNESVGGANTSMSGSALPPPAPPSPTGSHSSASSSLLPPGSGSASLSGGPSGTAGSAASDSQLGSSSASQQPQQQSQQQRFSEPCHSAGNTSSLIESPGRMSASSPITVGTPNHTAPVGSSFVPAASVGPASATMSPQRPPSNVTVNGYVNGPQAPQTPHSNAADGSVRSASTWPWTNEQVNAVPGNQGPPMMNGFPSSPSPIRGPMQNVYDSGYRSQHPNVPSSYPQKPNQTRAMVSAPQPGVEPIPPPVISTSIVPPSPGSSMGSNASMCTTTIKGSEPTIHHLPAGPYPPSNQLYHPPMPHPALNQHPQSPGHPPPSAPQSPVHPRMGGSNIRTCSLPPHLTTTGDSVALLRMHHLRPSAGQISGYPPGMMPPFHTSASMTNVPAHLIHHHGQRPGYVATILKRVEHYPFPPGSIEATQIEPTRRRRYRTKDIGPVPPFKLLMALRSGLTAEVSWALNCLNVLLRDDSGLECISPVTLPVLITNLVELWRHTLGELFKYDVFVSSLELPTDLTSLPSDQFSPTADKNECRCKLKIGKRFSGTSMKSQLDKLSLCPPSNSHVYSTTLMTEKSETSKLPNGLANLEKDIITLAFSHGLSLSSVREGIRRLLHRNNGPTLELIPIRARNGLMLRLDHVNPLLPHLTPQTGPIASNNLNDGTIATPTGLRSRKRGRQTASGTHFGYGASPSAGLGSSSGSLTGNASSQNLLATGKSECPVVWATARVTTAACSFRSPEACSNLRELALFVVDELVHPSEASQESELQPPDNGDSLRIEETKHLSGSSEDTTMLSLRSDPVVYLKELVLQGGGDTTCHIMPPFGASCPAGHWDSEEGLVATNKRNESNKSWQGMMSSSSGISDKLPCPADALSTPPPEVVKEKCTPRHELADENESIESAEGEDGQPLIKRARHTSASSLSCPILSPQPIDEIPEEGSGIKDGVSNMEKKPPGCVVTNGEDTVDENENEFSQLIMDANGRCPLRAREELVYHGPICLWPNHADTDSNEARAVRCLCVSTVLRNLSFLGVAESHLGSHRGVLSLIGRVILLGHEHVGPNDTWQTVDCTAHSMNPSLCAWRTPSWLEDMRENALVLLVNVAGYLDLINFEESIVRPVLEGLIHWIICPTAVSIDPFPGHRTLSPRRLALEALNRLCVHESNVDLLLCTPNPHSSDLSRLFDRLANWLALPEDQVTRELALSTMHYLTGGGVSFNSPSESNPGKPGSADSSSGSSIHNYPGTTMLASAKPCPISGLLSFIEAAEATTRRVIDQYGVQALQERPELMGTSLEMVRRAGALLDRLASDPTGRTRFTPNLELRLMDLVTSRVLDATVAHLLCGALHRLSLNSPIPELPVTTPSVPQIPSLAVVSQLLKQMKAGEVKPATDSVTAKVNPVQDNGPPPSKAVDLQPDSRRVDEKEALRTSESKNTVQNHLLHSPSSPTAGEDRDSACIPKAEDTALHHRPPDENGCENKLHKNSQSNDSRNIKTEAEVNILPPHTPCANQRDSISAVSPAKISPKINCVDT